MGFSEISKQTEFQSQDNTNKPTRNASTEIIRPDQNIYDNEQYATISGNKEAKYKMMTVDQLNDTNLQ